MSGAQNADEVKFSNPRRNFLKVDVAHGPTRLASAESSSLSAHMQFHSHDFAFRTSATHHRTPTSSTLDDHPPASSTWVDSTPTERAYLPPRSPTLALLPPGSRPPRSRSSTRFAVCPFSPRATEPSDNVIRVGKEGRYPLPDRCRSP